MDQSQNNFNTYIKKESNTILQQYLLRCDVDIFKMCFFITITVVKYFIPFRVDQK